MNTTTKTKIDHGQENAKGWLSSIEEMVERLETATKQDRDGGADETEASRREIEESVLSVMVREGWHKPGGPSEDGAEEYEILLTTGGPALRIIGQLSEYYEPKSAELQYQDWGTPWTRYPAPEATLLAFASVFYFGD